MNLRFSEIKKKAWWVGKELCEYLEIKYASGAIKRLPADSKKTITIEAFRSKGRGGDNGVRIIISEPGLYRLLSRQKDQDY